MNNIEKNKPTNQHLHDDEIDLKELLITLWKGKWIICILLIISTVISSLYAFTAQSWWTSKAIITLPTQADVYDYNKETSKYAQFSSNYKVSREALFNEFLKQFNFENNKYHFFDTSNNIKELKNHFNVEENNIINKIKFNEEWNKKIKELDDAKEKSNLRTISFQAISPEQSQIILNEYIQYINNIVIENIHKNFQNSIDLEYNDLALQINILETRAKEVLASKIAKTKNALQIANKAKILNPLENLGFSNTFPINIGSLALEEELQILTNLNPSDAKTLIFFEPELQKLYIKQDYLKNNLIVPKINFNTFSFVQDTSYPIKKDSPKRMLIILIGIILGGIVGCTIVLIKTTFKRNNLTS